MRLFALTKQFNLLEGSTDNAKDVVRVFLLEYASATEESIYFDIFEYHSSIFEKRAVSTKSLSLFSVKSTIICTNIVDDLPKIVRLHILLSIIEILSNKSKVENDLFDLIKTICTIFHIRTDELNDMLSFIDLTKDYRGENIIVISSETQNKASGKKVISEKLITGDLHVLLNRSTHAMFFYHEGRRELFLRNGTPINSHRIYVFTKGGVIENYKFQPLYYGSLLTSFGGFDKKDKIDFQVDNISFRFPDGVIAVHPMSFSLKSREMIGIIGNSGTGKTTLLNLLAGSLKPSKGRVLINGNDLHQLDNVHFNLIGLIPQDDVLVKELTVYQNLYFTARLCYQDKSPLETAKLVLQTLEDLGLSGIKGLRVGTPEKSIISGGQRKRLNMALELIREPQILFVDEPTSGLSSTDSNRVIEIIKTQTQTGKIAIVNIHQPSSDVFRMFDKILILDNGGRPVFFGNPLESLVHLKTSTFQVNSMERECQTCGNLNPEQILEIVEQRTLQPDGLPSEQRKYDPDYWYNIYLETQKTLNAEVTIKELPKPSINKAKKSRQLSIFLKRNFLSAFSDKQFLFISLGEAPLLAFILAFLSKNFGVLDGGNDYIFFYNQNIPAFFLMSIIVAMFFGLMIGAERIIKDRNTIRREKFLRLSRFTYINSKVIALTAFLAVQVTLFMLVGCLILGIRSNIFFMWFVLLSLSINGGMLALNLSSGLRTTVAIYISIPILLMPQLLLNGSLINFDKLHRSIASHGDVPLVANLAVSRWGYEALMVEQFSNNKYQRIYFDIDKKESQLRYINGYLVPEIEQTIHELLNLDSNKDSIKMDECRRFIVKEVNQLKGPKILNRTAIRLEKEPWYADTLLLQLKGFKRLVAMDINKLNKQRDAQTSQFIKSLGGANELINLKEKYTNEAISEMVLGRKETSKIIKTNEGYVRRFEPIYKTPDSRNGNAHFFSSTKNIAGLEISTAWFNILAIWLISIVLYIALCFDWLKKTIALFWFK